MKSVFLSFIIFFVVFLIMRSDILAFVSTNFFTYLVFGSFILVLSSAFYFIGIPKINTHSKRLSKRTKEKNDEK